MTAGGELNPELGRMGEDVAEPDDVESSSSEATRRGAPVLNETRSVKYLAASSRWAMLRRSFGDISDDDSSDDVVDFMMMLGFLSRFLTTSL